jgi:DNA repair exonuclease SbcCD ATPase subunit
MESFDTKDCDISESFDRRFECLESKDSELEEPSSEISESFDRKFEELRSKDSELEESANELSESFDRKVGSLESKDLELEEPVSDISESFNRKIEEFRSKDSEDTVSGNDSRVDGRSKPRSDKQIEAYKRNFHKESSIELKLQELDDRMRHLQSMVLRLVRGRWI